MTPMNVQDLLELELDTHLTISTEVFTLAGKAEVTLEDGSSTQWLFADEELFLAINPEAEEMVLFSFLETPIEKDDNIVVEQGKDYEFSYADRGNVEADEGTSPYGTGDDIEFSDYEADDGDLIRLVTNTFNGEERTYLGHVVTEEDVLKQE